MPERFINPLLIEAAISISLWVLCCFILSIAGKYKKVNISLKTAIIFSAFYFYIIGVMSLTVFPLPFSRFKEFHGNGINIIPFKGIVKSLLEIPLEPKIFSSNFQNIVGNIVLFIPLGIFFPLILEKYRSLKKIAILASICSASIELIQLILRHFKIYRIVDINDVILNTSGAILGFIIVNKLYFNK